MIVDNIGVVQINPPREEHRSLTGVGGSVVIGPLRFTPFLRPLVWGGRRLAEVLRKELPSADAFGESWEVSDHPSHRSVVAHGPLTDKRSAI